MTRGPQKQFDREEVLEKAMHLFWGQGYEATGMAQLLEHMGIGRQSLYDTFGDKRSLFLETLRHYFRTRVGPVLELLRAPGSPTGNVRKVFEYWGQFATCAGDCGCPECSGSCGCLVGNSSASLAHGDPEVAGIVRKYMRAVEDAFAETFRRAQQAGELRDDIPARDIARMFIHTAQGMALLSRSMQDPGLARSVMRTSMRMLEAR